MPERKLPNTGEIHVDITTEGMIDITQYYGDGHSNESVVSLAPYQVPAIIKWLQECLDELQKEGK